MNVELVKVLNYIIPWAYIEFSITWIPTKSPPGLDKHLAVERIKSAATIIPPQLTWSSKSTEKALT